MHHTYKTTGTCSTTISFDINDNIVTNISFVGGCNGNLKMISKLLEGQTTDYIIEKCSGNLCGIRKTSCADQLAKAVMSAVQYNK